MKWESQNILCLMVRWRKEVMTATKQSGMSYRGNTSSNRPSYIPHVPRQNTAELDIEHLQRMIGRRTAMKCSPRKLWGYCVMYCAGIRQQMASTDPTALGRTAYEQIHGYTPDITLYTRHDWYDMIFWFCSLSNTQRIGRYLGPRGKLSGAGDCHFILDKTGKIQATNSTKAISEDTGRIQMR